MNQKRSQSVDLEEDWLNDGRTEWVDRPKTEGEGQEVSGKCALGAQ